MSPNYDYEREKKLSDGFREELMADKTQGELAPAPCSAYPLSLELALIRWSVVHRQWHELANDMPCLTAFLAGWCNRVVGAKMPPAEDVGVFRDSWRVGWREADEQITISKRLNDEVRQPPAKPN